MNEIDRDIMSKLIGCDADAIPEHYVNTFRYFKGISDKIRPSQLSNEGYATVIMLAELAGGKTETAG